MACAGCLGKEEWGSARRPSEHRPPVKIMDDWRWHPIDPAIEERIEKIARRWIGTPYASGQQVRGGGVDCTHLASAMLDELHRRDKPTRMPRQPMDAGIHSARAGLETVKLFRREYPSEVVRDGTIEPGDVIVVRAEQGPRAAGRLGHVLIAGGRAHTVIHAIPRSGVVRSSLAGMEPLRVYRLTEKQTWI